MESSTLADEEHFHSLVSELVALHHRMVFALNAEVASLRGGKTSFMEPLTDAPVPNGIAVALDPMEEDLFVLNERDAIGVAGCQADDTVHSPQKSRLPHVSISIAQEGAPEMLFPRRLDSSSGGTGSHSIDQKSMGMGCTQSSTYHRDGGSFLLREEWQPLTDVGQVSQTFDGSGSGSALQRNTLHSSFSDPKMLLTRKQVPLRPDHKVRLCWEAVGAMLLAYDTCMLPMHSFDVRDSSTMQGVELFTVIFWTCDMLLSFCTGVSINGEVEMRWYPVFKSYAQSWMALDVFLVSLEWLMIAADTLVSNMFSPVGAVRNVRILRFIRLVRLVKLDAISNKLALSINSLYVLLSYNIIKMFFALAVACHIIGCIWYTIGADGWVELHIPDKTNIMHSYFTSLHWAIAQFHGSMEIAPRNLKERVFNVLIQLFALFVVSYVTSSLTNSMIMLQNLHRKRIDDQRYLSIFLHQRKVARAFIVQIKQQVATHHKVYRDDTVLENDISLLSVLPKSLLISVHEAVRAPSIARHPFFRHCSKAYPEFMRQLCHEATQEEKVVNGDVIFRTGQECNRMLFTNSIMSYTPGRPRSHRITFSLSADSSCPDSNNPPVPAPLSVEGYTWLSEPVLWTVWKNHGMLVSGEDSYLYAVDALSFLKAISLHDELLHIEGSVYATMFVQFLNERNKSDLPIYVDASSIWSKVKREFPMEKPTLGSPRIGPSVPVSWPQ